MTFNVIVVHNMCVLQLDPRFKGMYCIVEHVGRYKTIVVVDEYDHKVLVPSFVKVSKYHDHECEENLLLNNENVTLEHCHLQKSNAKGTSSIFFYFQL
jgi:hypothetical protein